MAATILDKQLQLTVVDDAAVPDVFINNQVGHVIAHLSKGFDAGSFPREQGNALNAGAHVPLGGPPGNTQFGFVQIARSKFFGAFYAGRIAAEGAVSVLAHLPPALPDPVMLDAFGSPPEPWFDDPSNSTFTAPKINASWGDHPAVRVPLKVRNIAVSNVHNFLFHLVDDREFWTIFTAKDPGAAPRYIAFFRWQVRHDVKFRWVDGQMHKGISRSFLSVPERKTMGRPSEPAIQAMLGNPTGTRAKDRFGQALTLAFSGPRGANRDENARRFVTVPDDFWR